MLRQDTIGPVPNETRRVAEAAFPDGHRYLRLADEIGTLFTDALFASLYPERGQPALPPWRLALVTMLQFAEGLSDRQAVAAVECQLDFRIASRKNLTRRNAAPQERPYHASRKNALLSPARYWYSWEIIVDGASGAAEPSRSDGGQRPTPLTPTHWPFAHASKRGAVICSACPTASDSGAAVPAGTPSSDVVARNGSGRLAPASTSCWSH